MPFLKNKDTQPPWSSGIRGFIKDPEKPLQVYKICVLRITELPSAAAPGQPQSDGRADIGLYPDVGVDPDWHASDPAYTLQDISLGDLYRAVPAGTMLIGYADAIQMEGGAVPPWVGAVKTAAPAPAPAPAAAPSPSPAHAAAAPAATTPPAPPKPPGRPPARPMPSPPPPPYTGPQLNPGDTVQVVPSDNAYWGPLAGKLATIVEIVPTDQGPMLDLRIDGQPYPAVAPGRVQLVERAPAADAPAAAPVTPTQAPTNPLDMLPEPAVPLPPLEAPAPGPVPPRPPVAPPIPPSDAPLIMSSVARSQATAIWHAKETAHIATTKHPTGYRFPIEAITDEGIKLAHIEEIIPWGDITDVAFASQRPIPGDAKDEKRIKKKQEIEALTPAQIVEELQTMVAAALDKDPVRMGKKEILRLQELTQAMVALGIKDFPAAGTGISQSPAGQVHAENIEAMVQSLGAAEERLRRIHATLSGELTQVALMLKPAEPAEPSRHSK